MSSKNNGDNWKPNKEEAGARYHEYKTPYQPGWGPDEELKQTLVTIRQTLMVASGHPGSDGGTKVTDNEKKSLEKQLHHALSVEKFDVSVLGSSNESEIRQTLEAFKKVKIDEHDAILGNELKLLGQAVNKDKGKGR